MSKIDIKSLVEGTDFTVEWLLDVLEKNNAKFKQARGDSNVVAITARDISEGKGFASRVFKTCVQFDDSKKAPYKFIMKIPTEKFAVKAFSTETQVLEAKKILDQIRIVHDVECEAYTLLKDIKDFPIAEIYYMQKASENSNGMIMMQDLSENCITMGIFRSITAEHCLNAARHFADLQAYFESIGRDKWFGKFRRSHYMKEDLNASDRGCLPPALEYNNGELKDQLMFYQDIDWYKLSCYILRERAEEIGFVSLCHGDNWTNNILIRVNDDGSVSNTFAAYVDWQLLFEGSPLLDISRLIVTCADAEVRREVEAKAVDLYYDRLTEKLKTIGQKVRFTREQAHELYELAAIHQTQLLIKVFTFLALPMEKTGNSWDKAKSAKIWLRLKLALEDAQRIIEKYNLRKKFEL